MTEKSQGETWWYKRNAALAEVSDGAEDLLLPDRVCQLLDQVEAAFASTGASTPGWAGRPADESPAEQEYSRCLDPEKFRIVPARTEAWVQVLIERGWAQLAEGCADEQRDEVESTTTTTTLTPSRPGAVPLVFAVYDSTDPDATLNVKISAGDPPEVLAELPGCGCDACDSGSAWLLEELDQWVLSVVDGSLIVDPSAYLQVRTSFGGQGMGGDRTRSAAEQPVIVAEPWSPDWTPMAVIDGAGWSTPPGASRGFVTRVLEMVRGVVIRLRGRPSPGQGWTVYSRPDGD